MSFWRKGFRMFSKLDRWLLPLLLLWACIIHISIGLLGPTNFWMHYAGRNYLNVAEALVKGQGYTGITCCMPLYPVILAGLLIVFGYASLPLFLLHVGISLLTTYSTYRVGQTIFSPAVGLLAGLLISINPYLDKLNMQIIDTGLSVALSTLGLWLFVRAWLIEDPAHGIDSRRVGAYKTKFYLGGFALPGVVFGLATLTRPVVAVTTIALGLGLLLVGSLKRQFRKASYLLVGFWSVCGIVISPWWIHNAIKYNHFIPLTTNGGYNFLKGHTPYYTGVQPLYDTDHYPYFTYPAKPDEPSNFYFNQLCLEAGIRYIKNNPVQAIVTDIKKVGWAFGIYKVPRTLEDSLPRWDTTLHKVINDGHPHPSLQDKAYSLFWTPILILGLLSIPVTRRQWSKLLPLFILIASTAFTIALTFADTRFRLEADPAIIVLASITCITIWSMIRVRLLRQPVSRQNHDSSTHVLHPITRLIVGGAQENTMFTAFLLDKSRYQVEIITGPQTGSEGSLIGEVRARGIPLTIFPHLLRQINPYHDFLCLLKLAQFIRRGKYTIVHTHSSKAGILGRLAARLAGTPIIIHTVHGWSFHEHMHLSVRKTYIFLERWIARFTDALIAVAGKDIDKGLKYGIGRPEQYRLIRSAIPLDEFDPGRVDRDTVRAELDIPPNAYVLGNVGRFSTQKNPLDWVRIAGRVGRSLPECRFLLVGDGPLLPEVKIALVEEGIIERTILTGIRRDVPRLMAVMDVFLLTSLWEGLPRVIPQAMAMGLPVVANAVDGSSEAIVSGETGYLCPPGALDEMANRCVELLRDPSRRQEMGRRGQDYVSKEFDVHQMVAQIDAVYQELLARSEYSGTKRRV
jgi:glycosyltransferase involved in cell wall biosynthesis/4-amino-4-deoxy-L-arabinose transferase-like glycosyltransferase